MDMQRSGGQGSHCIKSLHRIKIDLIYAVYLINVVISPLGN